MKLVGDVSDREGVWAVAFDWLSQVPPVSMGLEFTFLLELVAQDLTHYPPSF